MREGGTILCIGVPAGTEIGIDYVSWRSGQKFMGIKMIPPGVHFFFYSARSRTSSDLAPRTGLFVRLGKGDVLTLKWNEFGEDFVHESQLPADEVRAYAACARRFEFDARLGAYPRSGLQKWAMLSSCITPKVLDRVEPVGLAIVSAASRFEAEQPSKSSEAIFYDAMRQTLARSGDDGAAGTGADGDASVGALPPVEMTAGLRPSASPGVATGKVGDTGSGSSGGLPRQGDGDGGGGSGSGSGSGSTPTPADADGDVEMAADPDDLPPLIHDEPGADGAAGAAASPAPDKGKAPQHTLGMAKGTRLFFTSIPGVGRGSKPRDRTMYAMDTSAALLHVVHRGMEGRPELLLGELQFAFVCFLLGQSLEAFEQWKRLVDVLCRCGDVLSSTGPGGGQDALVPMLVNGYTTIGRQLTEVPTDFFASQLSKDNFLRTCMKELVNNTLGESTPGVAAEVRDAVQSLARLCYHRFRWRLAPEDSMPDPEDHPVIVDLSESMF